MYLSDVFFSFFEQSARILFKLKMNSKNVIIVKM